MILINIKMALTSLLGSKLRSFLTMLGIIIGVFSVITLVSIGEGVKGEISKQIEILGSNSIFIIPGKIDQSGHGFNPGSVIGTSTLNEDDLKKIEENVTSLKDAQGIKILSGVAEAKGGQSISALIAGVGIKTYEILDKKLTAGRWLTQTDLDSKAKVVVIDYLPMESLFPGQSPDEVIGQSINFQKMNFEVVGVAAKPDDTESLFGGASPFDNIISLPLSLAQEITENNRLSRIIVRTQKTEDVSKVVDQIKTTLKNNHGGEEDFSILTQDDILNIFNDILGILTKAISGIAAISLIVGGIGIMNIMLVAVTERTREIGIRKAVGATDGQILTQFLIESSLLSLLGGLIGFGLAIIAALIIEQRLGIPTAITVKAILLALGISLGVGIIFGIAPATKAARKNPIEALRYE